MTQQTAYEQMSQVSSAAGIFEILQRNTQAGTVKAREIYEAYSAQVRDACKKFSLDKDKDLTVFSPGATKDDKKFLIFFIRRKSDNAIVAAPGFLFTPDGQEIIDHVKVDFSKIKIDGVGAAE